MFYAIIGGIASGKSFVINILKSWGKNTLDCDILAKEIVNSPTCLDKISANFRGVVKNNILDNNALREIVFADKTALSLLNSIVHPLLKNRVQEIFDNTKEDLFVEVSAFVGSGLESMFDKVILIIAPIKDRIERIMLRNNWTHKECEMAINAQPDQATMEKFADCVIINDGSYDQLKEKLSKILLH